MQIHCPRVDVECLVQVKSESLLVPDVFKVLVVFCVVFSSRGTAENWTMDGYVVLRRSRAGLYTLDNCVVFVIADVTRRQVMLHCECIHEPAMRIDHLEIR